MGRIEEGKTWVGPSGAEKFVFGYWMTLVTNGLLAIVFKGMVGVDWL